MALERRVSPRLLCFVKRNDASALLVCGSIAAAATSGALVAIGRRLGAPSAGFAAIGTLFARDASLTTGTGATLAVVGLIAHLVASVAWTFVFVRFVDGLHALPGHIAWAGLLVAVLQLVLSWIIARVSGRGIATVLPLGDRVVLAFCLAISLVVGMRFAFSPLRNA